MAAESFFEKVEEIKMPIRVAILIGTLVLFIGVFVYLIYIPKTEEINTTTASIENLNRDLNKAKIQRKQLPERRKEKEEIDIQYQDALRLLPNTKEIPSLLRKITELGNESQLDFRVFRPQRERPREIYIEIPVSIEVRGAYHDVAVFFDRVGHMERIMNITNVNMRPEQERSTSLITTCDAITYRIKGN
jgi:type IV pilus assembly protein PilO